MIPFFCQNKATQQTTNAPVGLGSRTIPIADASSHFATGETVFISHSDGSAVEFLGTIEAADADSLTIEFATEIARATGALVWTPLHAFAWPPGRDVSVVRICRSGVEVMQALGGTAYATRLQTARESGNIRFANLTEERFEALRDWFDARADFGLEEFTYIDAARRVHRVCLATPDLSWRRTDRGLVAVEFELLLLGTEAYS
jgi:hypothetical protein